MAKGGGGGDGGAAQQAADEARKNVLRNQINSLYGVGADPSSDVATRLKGEEDALGTNLNDYYSNQGKDTYERAARALKFGAANRGAIGGTEYSDEEAQLRKDNETGSSRIGDAVSQAINNLRAGRESNRLNSINLVNSGSGADAVASAATGLKSSLDTANAATKQNLFADLFENLAFTKAAGTSGANNAAGLAALYGNTNPAYFKTPDNSGVVQR